MTSRAGKQVGYDAIVSGLRPPADADAILANVRDILPIVAAEASASAREGRLTADMNEAFRRAGVYRVGFSRRHGGPELSLEQQTRMVELVATIDAGIAWNAAILAATGFYAGRLNDEAFAELYPSFDLPTAGSFHPRGRAQRVAGGYRVTGSWMTGSGIHSAAYVLGGCEVFDHDEPILKADGSQLIVGVWLRTAQVEILDDWHVVGLEASGSSGYRVVDAFVPERHSFDRYFEPDPHAEPLNKLVDLPFYSMAGITVGLAQHAVQVAVDWAASRPEVGERALGLIGEAQSLLMAVRDTVYEGIRRIDEAVFTEGVLPSSRVLARGTAPVATDLTRQLVGICAELIGSRVIYESFPLERIMRDLVGVSAHASTSRARYVDVGRTMLADRRADRS